MYVNEMERDLLELYMVELMGIQLKQNSIYALLYVCMYVCTHTHTHTHKYIPKCTKV